MAIRVGINGFGRIGRNMLRASWNDPDIEYVAVNDITDAKTLAHLLKYDSVLGTFKEDVRATEDAVVVNGRKVRVLAEKEVGKLPWRDLGVSVVIESTGKFTKRPDVIQHIEKGGASKVIISAPATDPDVTIVLGVNDKAYDRAKHHVISNASCTTNCLAPVVKVLHESFGVERGFMTTIHSYTNDQKILDAPHKDLRRARAACVSQIPTTTGAAKAVGLVLPELKGKIDGFSVRVPTPDVSIVDFVAVLKKTTTAEEINAAFKNAAAGPLERILAVTDEPLVSVDFLGDPHSGIVDLLSTKVLEGNLAKVIAWYDNEWGYSCRLVDLAKFVASETDMNFVTDLDVKGKLVFLRVDFNVPLDDKGEIRDDTRIRASLPTILWLLGQGARLVIASHLGRPKGKVDPTMSLKPAAKRLAELIPNKVLMAPDVIGDEVAQLKRKLDEGEALLLENVRFYKEEEKNDPGFARKLAEDIDVFINDAFGSSHRAHASVVGIADFVPVTAAGFLMKKEVDYLKRAVHTPVKPYVAILGGAKVSDKIEIIESLLSKADAILIGGAMAYTFLKAQGLGVGKSLVEDDQLEVALVILDKARSNEVSFHLPQDHVLARAAAAGAATKIVESLPFPDDMMGVDIGPKTVAAYAAVIATAKTIFWNGPMGIFEIEEFAKGTVGVAKAVAASGAISIVGGGDSVAAVKKAGVKDKISHISTGGGASLEYIAFETLPGITALEK